MSFVAKAKRQQQMSFEYIFLLYNLVKRRAFAILITIGNFTNCVYLFREKELLLHEKGFFRGFPRHDTHAVFSTCIRSAQYN